MARETTGWLRLQLGGLLMAVGIGTMHYVGMEAMQANAVMTYDPALFILSIIVAHILATSALHVPFALKGAPARLSQPTGAPVLGCAVAGMHNTAMAAVTVRAGTLPASLRIDGVIDDSEWAGAEAADTFAQTDPVEGAAPSGRTTCASRRERRPS